MFTTKQEKPTKTLEEKILLLQDPRLAELNKIRNLIAPKNKDSNLEYEIGMEQSKIAVEDTIKKYQNEGKRIFTYDELVLECANYGLMISQSSTFKGELTIEFIEQIKKFIEENNLIVSEDEYRRSIYIVGKAHFNRKQWRINRSSCIDEIKLSDKETDPLLFFKLNKRGVDYYVLLNDSKSYKTISNRLRGYFRYNRSNTRTSIFFVLMILTSIFFSLFIDIYPLGFLLSLGLSTALSFVLNLLIHGDTAIDQYSITYENIFEFKPKLFGRISIIIIGLSLVLSSIILYESNAIKYTLNNKFTSEVIDKTIPYQEAKKVVNVEPNKIYYEETKSDVVYEGHWFYYTKNILGTKKQIRSVQISN